VSATGLVRTLAVDAVPVLTADAWRADTLRRVHEGSRTLTAFGRRVGADVLLTTVFQEAQHIELTRARVEPSGFHALTPELPEFHCFERELHEQTGVRIKGHPWLAPIRHEGQEPSAMAAHPFYQLEGKEVHEVQVGPIHAGVIEPGAFRFMCLGEQVHHLEIQLGYQHRGVERALLAGDARRLAPLVESVAGDTSAAHAWAYCAALEGLSGCELALETEVARAVALELERIAMHLAGLSGLAADVGFLQGATTYGRLRTTAINSSMLLCGSRFSRGALRPGGVRMRLTGEVLGEVERNLGLLRRDLAIIDDCFLSSETVRQRLRGVGVLSSEDAHRLGVVGMAARASNSPVDARQHRGGGVYSAVPIELTLLEEGDCWARTRIRSAELRASLGWIERALHALGSGEPPRQELGPLLPQHIAVAVIEGWRGEVVHCLETDEGGRLLHYKLQDPSLRNWFALAIAMRDNEISDFPICNKSFDLSYCGNDL
jgi:Ni,Fe-hydrogenase III large subunit